MSTVAKIGKKLKDAEAWKTQKRHAIVLPSGTEVDIEIPNLGVLMKTGQIPNSLIKAAQASDSDDFEITDELLVQQTEFNNKLVALTVKHPAITEEDVPDLPVEDVDLIVAIATRERDVDAIGQQIGGLHRSSEWRRFRTFGYSDTDVEDL